MEEGQIIERRPYLATECTNLHKCEKWRRQILGEISRKVSQIQNAGLPEFQVRDLNDEINKLIREKGHWEDQIKFLGGTDYRKVGPKMLDHDGKEVPGNRGYKYFGAAKDLPGVREILINKGPPKTRKTRGQLMKGIDADYYGYRDEDDGVIVPLETQVEKVAVETAVEKWNESGENRNVKINEEPVIMDDTYEFREVETMEGLRPFVAHVPVPTQEDVKDAILRKKKRELLQRYVNEDLKEQMEQAKVIANM